jgi:peptidoglycan/LPS O-acetylase OafA/YrhL
MLMATSPPLVPTKPGVHLPPLDGLRGLAVLGVMFYHFNLIVEDSYVFNGVPAVLARSGWCGVDLFFVLSGFLITGILLDAKGSPHYFRNFYARRTLRIFPLYYGLLTAVFLLGPRIPALATPEFEALAQHQWSLWFYYSNLTVAWYNDFFFNADWIEFNHFWSLAIEEQFYLVWPAVVLLCGRRSLAVACGALIVIAFLLRGAFVLHGDHVWTVYAFTPCRWDGLALGGLLALAWRTPGWWPPVARRAPLVAMVCFFALAGAAWQGNRLEYDNPSFQVFGYSALALFFGAFIVLAVDASASSVARRLWSQPVLRFFGKYSYGLYVVHPTLMEHLVQLLPVPVLAERWGSPALGALTFMIASLGLSVVLAWLIWHLYEKHFLRLKGFFESTGPRADVAPEISGIITNSATNT